MISGSSELSLVRKINRGAIKAFAQYYLNALPWECGEWTRTNQFNQNQTCEHQYPFHETLRILNALPPPTFHGYVYRYELFLVCICSMLSSPGHTPIHSTLQMKTNVCGCCSSWDFHLSQCWGKQWRPQIFLERISNGHAFWGQRDCLHA